MARPGREGVATLRLELIAFTQRRGEVVAHSMAAEAQQLVRLRSSCARPKITDGTSEAKSYPLLSLSSAREEGAHLSRACAIARPEEGEDCMRGGGPTVSKSRRVGSDRLRRGGMGKGCSSRSWFRAVLPCLAFCHPAISPRSFSRLGRSLSDLRALDAWHQKM